MRYFTYLQTRVLSTRYHKAVDLWRRYREAAAAVRAFTDHHESFLHALRPNDAPEAAQVSVFRILSIYLSQMGLWV